MRYLLLCCSLFVFIESQAQQINPVPDYVFQNRMSVGRTAVTDTAAYFSIGPRYGAIRGMMPPMVIDTANVSGTKRNGLLIFSIQKNKFLYWDSVRVQWSDMAGSSGSYITGSGILGYLPQFTSSTTLDTSALYTLGSRLGIGTSTFAYNSTNTANAELNGTAGGILGFKRNDSARGYLWHTGDNMELANTTAGSISFNTNSATRGSISSAGVWRLHNLAGTGDRVVQASSNGTLSASSSVTGLVDTATISTKEWRQKGIDSVNANVALKVNISDTASMLTPYLRKVDTSAMLTSYLRKVDTATMLSPYLRKIDTLTMLSPYVRAAGYGLSKSGQSLLVDTAAMATRARVQKAVDSLGGVISTGVTGTGTTNRVSKFTGTSAIGNGSIADSASSIQMTILSDGNIGIGTSTPNQKLTVQGATRINKTDGGEALIIVGNSNTASIQQNASDMYFNTNTNTTGGAFIWRNTSSFTERMRIDASGNVGIGVTPSAWQVDIRAMQISNAGSNISASNVAYSGGNNIWINNNSFINSSVQDIYTRTATAGQYWINGNVHKWLIAPSGTAGNVISFTEAMTLNANGELLIGTTADAGDYKLQVAGNAQIASGKLDIISNITFGTAVIRTDTSAVGMQVYNSTGTGYFGVERNSGKAMFTGSLGYATVVGSNTNHALQFGTNGAVRATIDNDGSVLINTTTNNGPYKLQINGDTYSNGLIYSAGNNAQIWATSMLNKEGLVVTSQSLTGSNAQGAIFASATWNTTGNPSLVDLYIVNTASGSTSNYIRAQDSNGDNVFRVTKNAEIVTAAPTGGSVRKWKLGEAATVSPTSPNRTIRVEIDGTVYYIHAKTTND